MRISLRRIALFFALAVTGFSTVAAAQALTTSEVAGKSDLRAEQSARFKAMQADPANLEAMYAYAGISARLEDFEAAIATLERMLIFNADLPRVRLELGALYFRIGAYPIARRYFESVAALPDLSAQVTKRVEGYLAQIAEQTRTHKFSGRVEVGIVADSNANLGPESRDVLLFGQPALLDAGSVEDDDIGGRIRAQLTHQYDLGGVKNDFWRTDASYLGRRYSNERGGNLDAVAIRTGPNLSLTALNYGPKLRPYVDAEYVRADDRSVYRGAGAGIQYRNTPTDEVSFFGDIRGGYRDYVRRDEEDAVVGLARVGVGWLPALDTVITASLTGQRDWAEKDHHRNTEGAVRLTASFAYDPDFSFVDDKWVLSAYASAGLRRFDEPDTVVSSADARQDREFRLGVSHVYNFQHGFYGTIGVDALWRKSNLPNFDLENFGASASIGYKF